MFSVLKKKFFNCYVDIAKENKTRENISNLQFLNVHLHNKLIFITRTLCTFHFFTQTTIFSEITLNAHSD